MESNQHLCTQYQQVMANVTQLCNCLADNSICSCLPQGNEMLCIRSHTVIRESISSVIQCDSNGCYASHLLMVMNQGLLSLCKSTWLIVFSQTANRMVNVLQTTHCIYVLKSCICLDLSHATARNLFYASITRKEITTMRISHNKAVRQSMSHINSMCRPVCLSTGQGSDRGPR